MYPAPYSNHDFMLVTMVCYRAFWAEKEEQDKWENEGTAKFNSEFEQGTTQASSLLTSIDSIYESVIVSLTKLNYSMSVADGQGFNAWWSYRIP